MLTLLMMMSLSLVVVQPTPTVTKYVDVIKIGVYNMTVPDDTLFQQFKDKYARRYSSSSEEEKRRHIFADNVMRVNTHNAQYARGETTYYLGINQFSDMTYEEIKTDFISCVHEDFSIGNATIFQHPENFKAPLSINWRDKGYVTPVKNQGEDCGSCWAFSAVSSELTYHAKSKISIRIIQTGAIEGAYFRKTCQLVSLSEQQLLDCTKDYGNDGCNGGRFLTVFLYVVLVEGLEREEDYPYKQMTAFNCLVSKNHTKVTIQDYIVLSGEKNLEAAVGTVGPVSVSIHASDTFMKYSGGVFVDSNCSYDRNHAMLVVGYGHDSSSGLDYWLVKNSYGNSWGDKGYIKMARNKDNMCQIASLAAYPIVESFSKNNAAGSGPCASKGTKNPNVDVLVWLIVLLIL